MDPQARIDLEYGFTQFIVGTGDTPQGPPREGRMPPEVAVASTTAYGILEMDLRSGGYDRRFVPADGSRGSWRFSEEHGFKIFDNGDGTGTVDEGSAACHGAPPAAR